MPPHGPNPEKYHSTPLTRKEKIVGAVGTGLVVGAIGASMGLSAAHVPGFYEKPSSHHVLNQQQFKDCSRVAGFIPTC